MGVPQPVQASQPGPAAHAPLSPLVMSLKVPFAVGFVPPQARAKGLEAGKSTCCKPSVRPSVEPLSPEATQTVTPSVVASSRSVLNSVRDCWVQEDSGPPQLMEITEGLYRVSWTAAAMAS